MRRYFIAAFIGLSTGLVLAAIYSYLVAETWAEPWEEKLGTVGDWGHAPDAEWMRSAEWNKAANRALNEGRNLIMFQNLFLEDGPNIVIPSCLIAVFIVYLRDRRRGNSLCEPVKPTETVSAQR